MRSGWLPHKHEVRRADWKRAFNFTRVLWHILLPLFCRDTDDPTLLFLATAYLFFFGYQSSSAKVFIKVAHLHVYSNKTRVTFSLIIFPQIPALPLKFLFFHCKYSKSQFVCSLKSSHVIAHAHSHRKLLEVAVKENGLFSYKKKRNGENISKSGCEWESSYPSQLRVDKNPA